MGIKLIDFINWLSFTRKVYIVRFAADLVIAIEKETLNNKSAGNNTSKISFVVRFFLTSCFSLTNSKV